MSDAMTRTCLVRVRPRPVRLTHWLLTHWLLTHWLLTHWLMALAMLIKAVRAAHLDAASYRRMLDGLVGRKDPCTADQLQALPRSVWISDENRGGCRGDPRVGGVSSAYDWFSGSEARTALCP